MIVALLPRQLSDRGAGADRPHRGPRPAPAPVTAPAAAPSGDGDDDGVRPVGGEHPSPGSDVTLRQHLDPPGAGAADFGGEFGRHG
jgi:hypothetical protein